MSDAIYESDPDSRPDEDFVAGELARLVVGNRGRLLDARRTPVTVTAVIPARGAFEIEIGAFEDAGARWELPLEEVGRFQFEPGGAAATEATLALLRDAIARLDRPLVIESDPHEREQTLRRLDAERAAVRTVLERRHAHAPLDLERYVSRREGSGRLSSILAEILADQDLLELEHRFAEAFVSNPNAGELVKGHAIVLAELGLCPYSGKIVRDPALFDGTWSKQARARHLVLRLAFLQELWAGWGIEAVTLYRGAAVDGPLRNLPPSSFVSATFSPEVAQAHFEGGPSTHSAVLWRQRTPIRRLFMTFIETPALSRQFKEAEAVLIGDPESSAF